MDPNNNMFDPMFSGMSLQSLLSLNPSLLLSAADDPSPSLPHLTIPKTEYHHLTPPQAFNFFPNLPQLLDPTTTTATQPSPSPSARPKPQSNLARQRRQTLSEKTRCLQKLMPWDKKMDQNTLLQETYKYVKFLQAQISALLSMPSLDTTTAAASSSPPPQQRRRRNNNNNSKNAALGTELERLSRNQALQVLVNSPVAQTMMSSQGLCVFSVEQLGILRNFSERGSLLFHHHMNMVQQPHADSKPFFN